MPKDYYKILGVNKSANADEIKAAFRKLAHEHHPDKAGGNADKFKEALEAYQVLSNDEKRKQYDQFGTTFEGAGAQGGFGGGFQGFDFGAFSEFGDLSDILGQMFGGGERTQTHRRARGKDIEKDLYLSFEEAVFGVTKSIDLYRHISCGRCDGKGMEPGSKMVSCDRCGGQGQVRVTQRTVFGNFQSLVSCDTCRGAGNKPKDECIRCRGIGVTRESQKIEIKIPVGAEDGGVLRILGEGEAAAYNGVPGDLYLKIYVKPNEIFERHGQDIYSRLLIRFKVAALGGKVDVKTVDGTVELKIPAGTQSGAQFRLRGKGVPYRSRRERGDQIVEVTIDVPTKLSKKQKQLLEEFDNLE